MRNVLKLEVVAVECSMEPRAFIDEKYSIIDVVFLA